jgi:hypothetical protein
MGATVAEVDDPGQFSSHGAKLIAEVSTVPCHWSLGFIAAWATKTAK